MASIFSLSILALNPVQSIMGMSCLIRMNSIAKSSPVIFGMVMSIITDSSSIKRIRSFPARIASSLSLIDADHLSTAGSKTLKVEHFPRLTIILKGQPNIDIMIFLVYKDEFVEILKKFSQIYFVEVLDYCVLGNHWHGVFKVNPDGYYTDEDVKRRFVLMYGEEVVFEEKWIPHYREKWSLCCEFFYVACFNSIISFLYIIPKKTFYKI